MNYFEKHIGDYLKDTAHLSLLEHGIYNRLFDVYYTRETALPLDVARLIGARSKDEKAALQSVLEEFFIKADDGWHQVRCNAEIARYKDKQAKAKRSADARWSASKSHSEGNANASPDAMRTHSEGNAPQSPVTSNHYSEPIGSGGKPPMSPDEIIFGYGVPLLVNAGSTDKAARSFLGGLRKGHGDTAVVNTLRDCLREKPLQPLEWLAAALPPGGAKTKPNAQEALEAANHAVAERFLAKDAHVAH